MKIKYSFHQAFSSLPLIIGISCIGVILISLAIYKKNSTSKSNPDSKNIPLTTSITIQKSSGDYAYENTKNTFQTFFKENYFKESSITFQNGESQISFYTPQNQLFGNLNASVAQAKDNTVIYQDVFTNTDLKYTLSSKRLLEEFIISTQPIALKFTKISQIANIKNIDRHIINQDGSIDFYFQNQIKFSLPKPVIYELDNQENKNYGIEYQITKITDNSYEINKIITPDGLEWLANLNRNYPIAIDLVIDNGDTVGNWTSSDSTNLPITQETSTKYEGTGSVKATAINLINTGDGADGALSPTGTFNLNSSTSGSRSYADGIAYRVVAPADGATSVTRYLGTDTLSNGIAAGDEVLIINLKGTSTDYSDVGNHEILEVSSVSASQIDFTQPITKSYNGTAAGNQSVVIQRVPNYTNVTLNSTDSLTASVWDRLTTTPTGTAGYSTGIVVFKASGTLAISASAQINVKGLGYSGGAGGPGTSSGGGYGGEAFCSNNGGGRGATSASSYIGYTGPCGGGGGGGSVNTNYGIGGSGSLTGGAGGGGGVGGGDPARTGGGGGGGYGTAATGGGRAGSTGGTNISGNGGNGVSGSAAGGGGGGGTYGSTDLSKIYFGSAGGGSAGAWGGNVGRPGGNGGGIVIIQASTINIGGTGINANGNNGTNGTGTSPYTVAGAGGGAAGSIHLLGNNISIGTTFIKAIGGSGGTSDDYDGGNGGNGRIYIESPNAISGTSNPSANTNTDPNALNDTISLSRSAIDLSSSSIYISFRVYSNKSGNQFQFQMGEVLNTEQTFPFSIGSTNTWEEKIWDISSIPASSRDAISKFAFKIINNDSNQDLYFDDINANTASLYFPQTCTLEKSPNNSSINIKWNDTNIFEDGYEIQKKIDSGSYSTLTTLGAGTTNHTDNSVSSGHSYQYKIIPYITGPIYGESCETSILDLQSGGLRYGGINMQGVKIY